LGVQQGFRSVRVHTRRRAVDGQTPRPGLIRPFFGNSARSRPTARAMPDGSLLSRLMAALLNVVAPPNCAACANAAPERLGFCAGCGQPKPAPPTEIAGVPIIAGS